VSYQDISKYQEASLELAMQNRIEKVSATALVDQLRNLSSHEGAYGLKSKYEVNCISRSGCSEDPANENTTFESL